MFRGVALDAYFHTTNKLTNKTIKQKQNHQQIHPKNDCLRFSFPFSLSLSLFVLFSASWFVIPINSHSDVVAVLDSHNLAVVVGIVVVVVVVHPFS